MPLNGSGYSAKKLHSPKRPERALAVAALAAVLFHRPLLGIFDKGAGATVFGIPVLFVYLFFAWSVIVALTALVMEKWADRGDGDDAAGTGGDPHSAAAVTVQQDQP